MKECKPSSLTIELDKKVGIMNEQIGNIEEKVDNINKKLDDVLSCKADKTEVDIVRADINKMKSWVIYSVVGGVIVFAITAGLKYIENLVK